MRVTRLSYETEFARGSSSNYRNFVGEEIAIVMPSPQKVCAAWNEFRTSLEYGLRSNNRNFDDDENVVAGEQSAGNYARANEISSSGFVRIYFDVSIKPLA
jgi:hypothetical protein